MKNKNDNSDKDVFTRRALVIGGMQAGLLSILGGRLAWMQIAQGHKYKMLSDKNRISLKMLPPTRGIIYDRNNVPLANNKQSFRVLILPEQVENLEKTLWDLRDVVDLSPRDIAQLLKRASKSPDFVPLEVKSNLDWEEMARVQVNLPYFPGAMIEEGAIRYYPHKEATSHLIGYVGAVDSTEIKSDPVLSLPGMQIGKTGIEKFYDVGLRGKAGTAEMEVNVAGREVRELKKIPGQPGRNLTLTVDSDLQSFTQDRLQKEKSAAAVVMDVHTGGVYALVSSPGFDPNLFTSGISAEKWEELLADPGLPLNNKAVGGQYPPGSTFKMVTALAGLEEGIITDRTRVHCSGVHEMGGDKFHCWKRAGHGSMNLISALAESCDVYFYNMAAELGIDKLAEYARKLGLGDKLGIELPIERPGLIPTKNWKMGHFGSPWQTGETVVATIGQGYIQTTPLQLAVMTSRLVNGGKAVKPWVIGRVDDQSRSVPAWPEMSFRKKNLNLVMDGMRAVVNTAHGTAHASSLASPFMMGGKTGTSQVRRISAQQRQEGLAEMKDIPWKYRDHALFVGYAPVDAPRYACAVVVEHGGSGAASAAPIARDILLKTQQINPVANPLIRHESIVLKPSKKPAKE